MSKIYISGPISGCKNFRELFAEAARQITEKGHEAINPCDMDKILNPATTSWHQFMLADLGLLRACDAIVLLEGWEGSKGSRIEQAEAAKYGLKIYKRIENIPEEGRWKNE